MQSIAKRAGIGQGMLLDACKAAGTVRENVEAEEVLLLVGLLWRIETDDCWPSERPACLMSS
jgi:hypothetical protein